ncbi:glutamine--fructose-6-phosphate transaminase (isomerizing) [Rhodobacteraceae bacterium NNCM2]|nr:glutamine--fructose-6-phosphate transaminase (isomerizing) [Coraliihabitans acroporae]
MCGIVGVLGQLEAAPRILDALKRLEYRGYDSAGLTTLENGVPVRRRAVGKLKELIRLIAADPAHGSAGIGHTRWATHGAPNVTNAHPHAAGPVHVVHNGIIENFRELRAGLKVRGIECETETDTEVVAQLVAASMADGMTPFEAVNHTLNQVTGAFALVFLFANEPNLMIAARHGSPLAIGWGEDEMFVGSDAMALSPMTSQITYLEEGDRAVITRAGADIFDANGEPVHRAMRSVSVDSALTEKGPHRHFMAKEIHEQPKTMGYVLSHYIAANKNRVVSQADEVEWSKVSRLILVACGTASYAGHVAKYWFEQVAGIPVELDIASEFRYREPPLNGDEVAIFISQSGETADTLAALRYAKGRVSTTIAVVNVVESSIAREVDIILPTLAGPEIGVASTKAFTSQLGTLACTAILAARMRGAIDSDEERRLISKLLEVPRAIMEVLSHENVAAQIAQDMSSARDILFLGRGTMFPVALEGALKLKEISYIHAAGHASGELKHGPIALVDEKVPVVVMAPRDSLFEKTVSNMQEVIARGGKVVLITDHAGADEAGDEIWRMMVLPDIDPFAAPILYAIPAQLIAYFAALAKGTDVDQPRNLAKSVTVE